MRLIAFALLGALAGCDRGVAEYRTHPVVSATVAHFAPNVELGGGIERMSVYFAGRRWIPYLGAVTGGGHARFTQMRFVVDDDARARAEIDWRAPLRAIEMVSTDAVNRERTMSEVAIAFGTDPLEGCLAPADTALPLRAVQYWVAPDSAGGIAIVSDWMHQSATRIDSRLWSLWAWSGAFRGGRTLLGRFVPAPCSEDQRRAPVDDGSSTPLVALDRAFRESLSRRTSSAAPGLP